MDITLFENKFNSNTVYLKISLITVVPCILGINLLKLTDSRWRQFMVSGLNYIYLAQVPYRLTFELSLSVTKGIIWWKSKVNVVSGYIYFKKNNFENSQVSCFPEFFPTETVAVLSHPLYYMYYYYSKTHL